MGRFVWISTGGLLLILLSACAPDLTAGSGGAGGTGGAGGMGGSASSSSGGVQCMGIDTTPCVPMENACRSNSKCVDSQCTWDFQPVGTQIGDDPTYGDCKNMQCDAMGEIVEGEKSDDVYDFANPCYKNNCSQGATLEPADVNTPCVLPSGIKGVCDGNFRCVQCNVDTPCSSSETCNANGLCVDIQCADNIKNGNETDIDCGGNTCPQCIGEQACLGALDCASPAKCVSNKCAAPSCMDDEKNGDETDIDCGGTCATAEQKPCGKALKCLVPGDCVTGKCIVGACQ